MSLPLKEDEIKQESVINNPSNKNDYKKEEKKENTKEKKIKKNRHHDFFYSSSLFFQTFLYYNPVFYSFYFVIEIILFIYKLSNLDYPTGAGGIEISILSFFMIVNIVRLYFGWFGNETETSKYVFYCSFILSPFTLYSFFYFMLIQTYVLKIEIIFNSLGVFLNVIEVLIGVFAFVFIRKSEVK